VTNKGANATGTAGRARSRSADTAQPLPPLDGIRVVDFSTLLPGPLCSLLLAHAGAEVIKIERPGGGDEMRSYTPRFGKHSVNFAMLNRGKRSVAIDLKTPHGLAGARALIRTADVLVEQFRPGVMERLGLGYNAMRELNPRLIYCSITGWGSHGPMADFAAHDLNYLAETGMLHLAAGADGTPGIPPALIADIGGGAYPAMMNILLALRARDADGAGRFIDVAMADNLFTFMYWALGNGAAAGQWPTPGGELVTGGSPRYQVYRTLDGKFLAAAPLEQKFWENFLRVLEAPQLVDDSADPKETRDAIARIIATRTSDDWMQRFEGVDACVTLVKSVQEAIANDHFRVRSLFEARMESDGVAMPALPLPISPALGRLDIPDSPLLGEGDDELLGNVKS
jgi:alpha-methylacyl-CoA racemase